MSDERIGPWISTYTGGIFYPLDPHPEEIDILDIAQSSALTTRYRGHIKEFYSVAQHQAILASYILMTYGNAEWAMKAMIHDGGETYTADLPSPLKDAFAGFYVIEERILKTIFKAFGMSPGIPREVHEADVRIKVDEVQVLLVDTDLFHDAGIKPLGVTIKPCWPPNEGRLLYMKYFGYLSDMLARQRGTGMTTSTWMRRPLLDVLAS